MPSKNIPIVPVKWVLRRIDTDIDYNHRTGVVTWINPRSPKLQPGDLAGAITNGHRTVEFCEGKIRVGVRAHHIAWYKYYGEWPAKQIDHTDTNGLNNRIRNLRLATDGQNIRNRGLLKSNRSTGITGVTRRKSKTKYEARLTYKGRYICLGHFDTLEEAKRARRKAEKIYFKRFRYNHSLSSSSPSS